MIGEREQELRTVSVKGRANADLGVMTVEELVSRCVDESKVPF